MNRRQRLVQRQFLNNEQAIIKRLKSVYAQSLKDVNEKIKSLEFSIDGLTQVYDWMDDDDPQKEIIKSRIQAKIYQKQYQEQLQKQVGGILDQLKTKNYLNITDYLDECYSDGFIGTIFDMHGQGVPLMMPINQESMVRAVQIDSKISKGLYTRLGEDVDLLKRKITAQVSRAISSGMSYAQTAQQLSGYTRIGFNNAVRIARTEGHRIQCSATMDACELAKERGADVVKQWDATLDDRTRESHQAVDGEIRELDEKFSNGLRYPGDPAGGAAEVVNCRCALLQRARWALDTDELKQLEDRAAYFGLDKSEQFGDFKQRYLNATSGQAPDMVVNAFTPAKTLEEAEAFITQYVDESHYFGALGVSYSGISLESANEINRVLSNLFETFDFDKLGGVYIAKGNTKLGKMVSGATAAYSPTRGSLLINNKSMKNLDSIVKSHAQELEIVKKYAADPTSLIFKTKRAEAVTKASILSGRATVPDTIDDVIHHEMGHALEKKLKNMDGFGDVINNKSAYAEKISGYATTDNSEYIAESFASYLKGEDRADPALVKLFEALKK